MAEAESKLQQQVDRVLAEAERNDAQEDANVRDEFRRIAFTHNLLKAHIDNGTRKP